ncbi:amidohydrolase family protein [Hoeflea olei]|uniref:Amidohydrolase n=1 Tax=Hoeflea olei TaxID=1480615 RepID=A0A1C1Z197_9HYPH|nr:amidohydrolase family protein [Hoeflea olei]OCW59523.1 amidohydrolase [Hoeflea olei]
MRIDSHQHFWQPARGDYDWMPMDNAILARPYVLSDLALHLEACGIGATVLVQAAATVCETEYMLGIADATPSVAGVVGWVDFENPSDLETLKRLSKHPKFKGVRPMIQDIPDVDWMHREDVQWGFRALCDFDLTFDALGFPRHLDNFLKLLKRYPDMRAVVDHCMKPQIRSHGEQSFRVWADGMARIADQTRACCKLSGLVTEAAPEWTEADLAPYASHVISAFGAERVMWGSDWPVCRLASDYETWFATAEGFAAGLSAADQGEIFGGTAKRFYRLEV